LLHQLSRPLPRDPSCTTSSTVLPFNQGHSRDELLQPTGLPPETFVLPTRNVIALFGILY
ncbi:hypothetical protein NDU88_002638, partial [Pleurodeles waltl]